MGMQSQERIGDADVRIATHVLGSGVNVACAISIAARRIGQLDRMHSAFEDHVAQIYMEMLHNIQYGVNDPILNRHCDPHKTGGAIGSNHASSTETAHPQ